MNIARRRTSVPKRLETNRKTFRIPPPPLPARRGKVHVALIESFRSDLMCRSSYMTRRLKRRMQVQLMQPCCARGSEFYAHLFAPAVVLATTKNMD